MKSFAAVIGAALVLSACATKRESNAVAVGESRIVRYTLPAELAGKLSDAELVAMYAEAAKRATAYRLEYRDDRGAMKGVRVSGTASGVDVSYVHQYSATLHHTVVGTFAVTIARQPSDVTVDVACPSAGRVETANQGMGYSAFIEPEKASADLRTICSRANLVFERRETGEVDVPFNDTSVYANFKRKLSVTAAARADARQGDLAKFLWYSVQDGTRSVPVGITVYPYRNGSKVTYVWLNNVVCRPNGPCNFDPTAPKRLGDVIAAVAND
jgi:hypothetical protein